ncbi:MAG: hypothetical protein U0263_17420 [Polyangiaceae bacterium]
MGEGAGERSGASSVRIAVVGDVHLAWDERDREDLDGAGYDLVAFVGDLAGYRQDALGVAQSISRLRTPAFVVPATTTASASLTWRPRPSSTLGSRGCSAVANAGAARSSGARSSQCPSRATAATKSPRVGSRSA